MSEAAKNLTEAAALDDEVATEVEVGQGPRLRLDLEYDGTAYAGWQRQANAPTVQAMVEDAVRTVLAGSDLAVVAAGRTDSGVHAVGQVAHVQVATRLPAAAIAAGVNTLLPRDIRLRRVSLAPPGFHARFSALSRAYRYQIWQGSPVPPFLERYAASERWLLDVASMQEAAGRLKGTHDLSAFRSSACTAKSPRRTVTRAEVQAFGSLVVIAMEAKAFLHHMVRNVVGALLQVGRRRLTPDDLQALIASRDRRQAPAMAPAKGLFLWHIAYRSEELVEQPLVPVLTCSKSDT